MPNSYLCTREDLEKKNNGRSLVLVLRKSGIPSKRIVHKETWDNVAEKMLVEFAESGMSNFPCYEPIAQRSTQKQRKNMENCRYTMQPIWKRWKLFFAYSFLQTSSVFTEQSQRCVKITTFFTKERGDML